MRPHRFVCSPRRSARGLSLLELLIASSLLTIGLIGTLGSITQASQSARTSNERDTAMRAAADKLDEILCSDFSKLAANYDSSPANDPSGAGTAPGATFTVTGLPLPKVQGTTAHGIVLLPNLNYGSTIQIREDINIPSLGMPRDLNGDTLIDSADHSSDYKLLPVLVEVQWQAANGVASLKLAAIVSAK